MYAKHLDDRHLFLHLKTIKALILIGYTRQNALIDCSCRVGRILAGSLALDPCEIPGGTHSSIVLAGWFESWLLYPMFCHDRTHSTIALACGCWDWLGETGFNLVVWPRRYALVGCTRRNTLDINLSPCELLQNQSYLRLNALVGCQDRGVGV